ncbi:MAG: hypothetical protein E7453_06220 [Ruminococcaceae bacterium]|nr:hypothetical protein [Oscillospiraceae bacterium]
MGKTIDLTGQRFGQLLVIQRVENHIRPNGKHESQWLCRCECGVIKNIEGRKLRAGRSKSCGCRQSHKTFGRQTHGLSGTRLYLIWTNMKQRCLNENDSDFHRYGGRGITIYDRWTQDFEVFYNWAITNGYREDLSIDRIDNDMGYFPDNCRWVSKKVQNSNKSNNIFITISGQTKTLSDWCRQYNCEYDTVRSRIRIGWSVEEALGLIARQK